MMRIGGAKTYAVDIGSTVIKLAMLDEHGDVLAQIFQPRDFAAGIAAQVRALLDAQHALLRSNKVRVCSSANGGLRVGIVCLTKHFSGSALRNQVLLAGANPLFVHDMDDEPGVTGYVDILIVAGGIDCDDCAPLRDRLAGLQIQEYRFGSLVYAGNKFLVDEIVNRHPRTTVIENPLCEELSGRVGSVFETVRRAYLDDLVHKEGISELGETFASGVRPTPEVVSRGFQRAISNFSTLDVTGACVLLDIGGATTDLHYAVEIIRDDSPSRPWPGTSVARYVFTDLGIVASLESLLLQMRGHPRLYEFLEVVTPNGVRETYQSLREGEHAPSAEMLSYGCLFIALDRFVGGNGPGLPTGDLNKVSQFLLTGGAAQTLCVDRVAALIKLLLAESSATPVVVIDREYRLWVEGITWAGPEVATLEKA